MRAGVGNAQVLLRELRKRNYTGGYTILKDWLHPERSSARTVAVRRFETPPGKQAQVDWGHICSLIGTEWHRSQKLAAQCALAHRRSPHSICFAEIAPRPYLPLAGCTPLRY
jgi:hypothetical protein